MFPPTATGTIAIHVADANDNCPTLTKNLEDICSNTQVVIVTATDNDAEPNGGPFLFSIVPKETTGLWGLEPRTGRNPPFKICFRLNQL